MAKWGPILIGAAIGAGTAAVTGGDPLKGAVFGGVGGAIGGTDFSALGGTGKGVVAGKSGGISLSKGFGGVGADSAAGSMATGGGGGGLFGMSTGQLVGTAFQGAGVLASASSQSQQGLNTEAQAKFNAQLTQDKPDPSPIKTSA